MTAHDWDAHYREGELPWDTGSADPHLVEFVGRQELSPGKALEIVEIRSTEIHADIPSPAKAWLCVARPRRTPAQPSTGRRSA